MIRLRRRRRVGERCETCGRTLTRRQQVEITELLAVDTDSGVAMTAYFCRTHAPKEAPR